MKNNLQNTIAEAKDEFLIALDRFDQGNINTAPFEGSWTGGQVGEHLLKSAGVVEAMYGRTAPTTGRPPDEKVPMLRIFLDFSIKMKSPDFILPSDGFHARQALIDQLQKDWERLGVAVETLDLSETCLDFEMPNVGHLTRLEWVSFYVFHTKRHLHQLRNILASLQ